MIGNLETFLETHGLGAHHCIHVGPLIRREREYEGMLREERQSIFRRMMAFVRKADISYKCFLIDKHFDDGNSAVHDELLQGITRFLINHTTKLNSFDRLKITTGSRKSQCSCEKHLQCFRQRLNSLWTYIPNPTGCFKQLISFVP